MPRSPSMRPKSGGCTWSPSRGSPRAVPTAEHAHARIDDWPTARRHGSSTSWEQNDQDRSSSPAPPRASAPPRAAVRQGRAGSGRAPAAALTGSTRWPTNSATSSIRSSSTSRFGRRLPKSAELASPCGLRAIDLLLNNAGLAPPMSRFRTRENRRVDNGHRHQHQRAGGADPRAAADPDRAQGRDHQPVVGRGHLSLSRRRGLRRHQGVRPPIQRSACAATSPGPESA